MNFLRTIYAFTTIALISASCSKQTSQTRNNTDLRLTGSWKWLQTAGGFANNIQETPASTGNSIVLKITNDSKYLYYKNENLVSEGTYVLETRNCIHDHKDKTYINFSSTSDPDMMIEKLDYNNLELSDEAYDGIGRIYRRQREDLN